ncbi:hypothetical protein EI555_001990 [Monodon monoceros]|uniref:Basic proline-rich protein-like n=1 Tax=Monodon monoceros TaxID=40151 RepID=A0A4U1EUH4_MONMO|nr:hypothetical protein EI555_001990 [Monodon monoceros]
MDQDTTFPPFNISAQHWRVTYKPPTNKQRRSLAGEGEEEAGEGDVRSFPSQKRFSKGGWKPSSPVRRSFAPISLPPGRTPPLPSLPGPPSRSRSLPSRLKLPTDPPRALLGSPGLLPPPPPRRSPRAGSPGGGGTHAPAKRIASFSQLSPRGPACPRPRKPGLDRQLHARPKRGCSLRRRPALATHTPPERRVHPPPPALSDRPGLCPAPGRWAAARAPRRPHPPPGQLPSSPPHPDPPADPLLTGGRAGFAGRREPTRSAASPVPGPAVSAAKSPRAPGVSG